jgi:hypothetical protein
MRHGPAATMKLDDTLSDACDLLDSMGTCEKDCSGFDATKEALEKLCSVKERRDRASEKRGEWLAIGDHEVRKLSGDERNVLIFTIAILVPVAILFTLVHETGHAIVATSFGWEIVDFKISFFPFILDAGGHVTCIVPGGTEEWKVAAMYSAGSLFSLAVAYAFLAMFYTMKLNRYVETFFFAYSIILGIDAITYIFSDLFFGGDGDWLHVYSISPVFVGIVLVACILNIVLFAAHFTRITRKLDV